MGMNHNSVRALAFVLATVFVLGSAGCIVIGGSPEPQFRETRTSTLPPVAAIEVKSSNGGIVVRRAQPTTHPAASPTINSASQTIVTANVAARTAERLAGTRVVSEVQPDGTLLISVAWPNNKPLSNESCSFDITVPSDMRSIRCNTSNGEIRMTQLAGEANIGTSNGKIVVEDHVGVVRASTSNGAVTLKRVTGDVDVHTSNGAVDLSEIGGAVEAHTSNGRVDLALATQATRSVNVRTSNGAVNVTLPASYAGRVDVSTGNGAIRFPGGPSVRSFSTSRNHASFTIGEGSATSTIVTSNGDVDLKMAP
jgi:hypothetical protein